ncbi:hypothetical protein HH212_20410 [Massilia forsythiae]|uniref:Uncharacterized protein n=1 Tax=Massilia forsythiae TaxID=2728020 RepID=A0A7Z2VZI5_9BURK|nr:hypothetical protein [Massilia forsythiae]QJE02089.1 hypothetical protein HH212_20410 [Massilia forsythiae]
MLLPLVINHSSTNRVRKNFAEDLILKTSNLVVRSIATLGLLVFTSIAMADQIFLNSKNAVSGRMAILEDDGQVAHLYLTAPSSRKIERDVILYMRIQPITEGEWKKIMAAKSTPRLTINMASTTAVIEDPAEHEFEFCWSHDGNSVAALRHGMPLAFISAT